MLCNSAWKMHASKSTQLFNFNYNNKKKLLRFVSSSSKVLKMEAYDAAVLSYALATAAGKLKPGLLGVPSSITSMSHSGLQPPKFNEEVSHTPPTRQGTRMEEDVEQHGRLYQLLCSLEQAFVGKGVVQLPQLLEICSCKQVGKDCNQLLVGF